MFLFGIIKQKEKTFKYFILLILQNIPLFLNLSLCYLNWKQDYEAINAATEVLKRDKLNEKALYRRAKGRIAVWDLEKVFYCSTVKYLNI